MKNSIKKGMGFGLTSGIITTLGIIIGLYFGTKSIGAVIGGILIIAIADSLSDATGMHISEETNKKNSKKQIWEATISTFLYKMLFTSSFILLFLILSFEHAVYVSLVWGFLLIGVFSFYIAKLNGEKPCKAVAEHLIITIVVMIVTYFVGMFIHSWFF